MIFAEGCTNSTAVALHVFTMLDIFYDGSKREIVLFRQFFGKFILLGDAELMGVGFQLAEVAFRLRYFFENIFLSK